MRKVGRRNRADRFIPVFSVFRQPPNHRNGTLKTAYTPLPKTLTYFVDHYVASLRPGLCSLIFA